MLISDLDPGLRRGDGVTFGVFPLPTRARQILRPHVFELLQGLADGFRVRRLAERFTVLAGEAFLAGTNRGNGTLRLVGRNDGDRAAVMLGRFLFEIAKLGQLAQVIRHVGAEIIAAFDQIAHRNFALADVGQQKRLNAVQIVDVGAGQFGPDDVKQTTVQAFDKMCQFPVCNAQSCNS